ncbi:DNA-3-methyladenine glycosylase family protein [Flammeovirga agarivorans]|uniref:DNA-3-methyladenine glycosylase II n=1 Tax=Flammeovirga agarivorans TaxID=2726742 RepID=A0A7X8SNI3_9BACT|nr:DNA-3-methyladenine glycosylase 2 family protein [Flammeovirga agarivorans]NLR93479.1 DNA-3-methyladenine glycosylase 2 family protein [Flammeovirga agarivorans]
MIVEGKKFLMRCDPVLQKIIPIVNDPIICTTNNVFNDLLSCVIEQQIHYRSTKKQFKKLLDKADLQELTPENFSIFEDQALKDAKLSERKFSTIANVIEFWTENNIPWHQCSDEEVVHELSKIKGIGKWSIDMILLYTLNRPNIFSLDDFHIKQIMTSLYQLDSKSRLKAQMKTIIDHWHPHQSTAFLYLLEWKKANKEL